MTTNETVDLTPQARAAADWLATHTWIQGEWGDDTKACLHGAVRRCTPRRGDGYIVSAVLTAKGYGTGWNDNPDRTEVEVLDLLRTVEVSDADLEATFGPNWRLVVAVVRQAADITEDQAKQLAAAGDAARGAACDAACDAAFGAACDAARTAAWGAACDAAWGADRTAAVVARTAGCAAVKDLITPEQYDTLTGPWVSVMGPIKEAR